MYLCRVGAEIQETSHEPNLDMIKSEPFDDQNYSKAVVIKTEPVDFEEDSNGNSFHDVFIENIKLEDDTPSKTPRAVKSLKKKIR